MARTSLKRSCDPDDRYYRRRSIPGQPDCTGEASQAYPERRACLSWCVSPGQAPPRIVLYKRRGPASDNCPLHPLHIGGGLVVFTGTRARHTGPSWFLLSSPHVNELGSSVAGVAMPLNCLLYRVGGATPPL